MKNMYGDRVLSSFIEDGFRNEVCQSSAASEWCSIYCTCYAYVSDIMGMRDLVFSAGDQLERYAKSCEHIRKLGGAKKVVMMAQGNRVVA